MDGWILICGPYTLRVRLLPPAIPECVGSWCFNSDSRLSISVGPAERCGTVTSIPPPVSAERPFRGSTTSSYTSVYEESKERGAYKGKYLYFETILRPTSHSKSKIGKHVLSSYAVLRQYNLKLAVTAISLGPPCGFAVQGVQTFTFRCLTFPFIVNPHFLYRGFTIQYQHDKTPLWFITISV